MHGIFCKNLALRDLEEQKDENRYQATLMLVTDKIHEIN